MASGCTASSPRRGVILVSSRRGAAWQDPGSASAEDMERWIDLQGPRSPALLDEVVSSDADVLASTPTSTTRSSADYLVVERAVMHPAAHEEPALHLPVFDELFARCRGFVFQTRSERRWSSAVRCGGQRRRSLSVWGCRRRHGAMATDPPGLRPAGHVVPHLHWPGRRQKGTTMLSRFFLAYRSIIERTCVSSW